MLILDVIRTAWPELGWITIAIMIVTITVTYTIFGMMGFGSALIAAPILALRMPLPSVVPLLALLDMIAAAINTRRLSNQIVWPEILWLAPLMAAGSAVGIYALLTTPPEFLMIGLGGFVIGYALYGLFYRLRPRHLSRRWVVPFGLIGGVLSGMFGSGGFVYSIYLSHRMNDKDAIRATMTAMTGLSTLTRVIMFIAIGVLTDFKLLLLAAIAIPALSVGIFLGHHITLRISHEQFLRILCMMLIGTGSSLIWRALHLI